MRRRVFLLVAVLVLAPAVHADTILVEPILDNTLYDDTAADGVGGAVSNGVGPHLYAGLGGSVKRGLIAFDLSSIPPGSTVSSVMLTMNMNRTHPLGLTADVSLHRVLTAWGEGTSNAGGDPADPTVGGGGTGSAATAGDATWLHGMFNTAFWTTPGGDFATTPSATTSVTAVGTYSWSGAGLTADVQAWVDDPASNSGWAMIGDEVNASTAKRFSSREADDPMIRPQAQIIFTPPVMAIPTLGTVGFGALMVLLAAAAMVALRRRRLA